MSLTKKFTNSFFELKNAYSLATVAMLLALRIVLGFFANATLPFFGNTVKISGAFLPIAIAGVMFGPVSAAIVGAAGDILSFIIAPTGMYFPGFTINGLITGLIYGMFFYKSNITIKRVITAWFVNTLCVETFLHAFWLYTLYSGGSGKTYYAYLITRLISEAIKLLPEILLIYGVGKLTTKIKIPSLKKAAKKQTRH